MEEDHPFLDRRGGDLLDLLGREQPRDAGQAPEPHDRLAHPGLGVTRRVDGGGEPLLGGHLEQIDDQAQCLLVEVEVAEVLLGAAGAQHGDLVVGHLRVAQVLVQPVVEQAAPVAVVGRAAGGSAVAVCRRPVGAPLLGGPHHVDQPDVAARGVDHEPAPPGPLVHGVVVAGLEEDVDVALLGQQHPQLVRRPDGVQPPRRVALDRVQVQPGVIGITDELVHRLAHPPAIGPVEVGQRAEPIPPEAHLWRRVDYRHSPALLRPANARCTVAVLTERDRRSDGAGPLAPHGPAIQAIATPALLAGRPQHAFDSSKIGLSVAAAQPPSRGRVEDPRTDHHEADTLAGIRASRRWS